MNHETIFYKNQHYGKRYHIPSHHNQHFVKRGTTFFVTFIFQAFESIDYGKRITILLSKEKSRRRWQLSMAPFLTRMIHFVSFRLNQDYGKSITISHSFTRQFVYHNRKKSNLFHGFNSIIFNIVGKEELRKIMSTNFIKLFQVSTLSRLRE